MDRENNDKNDSIGLCGNFTQSNFNFGWLDSIVEVVVYSINILIL